MTQPDLVFVTRPYLVFGVSSCQPVSAEAVEVSAQCTSPLQPKVMKTSLWLLRTTKELMVPPYSALQVALGVLQKWNI